ncbi:MAG: helix-turn-helix domain-containing protein [Christensenella sp.]|nr:helix-turn-helix domain-containing protein [Christensenella sp.]
MAKRKPNKKYTAEYKQEVIETMYAEKLSYREVARQFEISDRGIIQKWERIYLEEGPAGLAVERRGRASAASGAQKGRPPRLRKKVEEDLLAEVQRLRAENDYLKNLHALVSERVQREKKRKQ